MLETIELGAVRSELKVAMFWVALLEEPGYTVFNRHQKLVLEAGLWTMTLDDSQHELARPRLHPIELLVVRVDYRECKSKHSQIDNYE